MKESNKWNDPESIKRQEMLETENRKKLDRFSELIGDAPRVTEEVRRQRIHKFENYKRISKYVLIIGLVLTVIGLRSIGQWCIIGGILGTVVFQGLMKTNMTSQMLVEYENKQLEKERKSYGLPSADFSFESKPQLEYDVLKKEEVVKKEPAKKEIKKNKSPTADTVSPVTVIIQNQSEEKKRPEKERTTRKKIIKEETAKEDPLDFSGAFKIADDILNAGKKR